MNYSTYDSIKRGLFFSISLILFACLPQFAAGQVSPPSSVTGNSEPIGPNTFSLCAESSLILVATCAQNNYAIWPNDERNPFEIVVLPGVNTYDVVCSDEVNESEPVTVTVIGGCVEEDICAVPPSASNLQATGVLSAENCSVRLTATASGKSFQFTGPGGYVFSVVYRNCQQNVGIYANDVKLPGIYTLKVNGGGEPATYTIEVGGTACQP